MVSFQSAKEEIKQAADIVELIGQYVQLKKVGRNHVGLCPFHAEKAPSFTVSPERQTFHCFGCKKGGDLFSFWMEYHGATFPEAVRDLAERYHIAITEHSDPKAGERLAAKREALFHINERAARYFQRALDHPKVGEPARAYLKERHISEEVIAQFRLGWAPQEWEGVTQALRRHGVDMNLAVEAGLIISREQSGYYDRFRGRLIYPIFDLRQRVVGFGGRVLDDALPKYLNTPETPVFRKGETLYGLNVAHTAIRQKKRAVIVEGYMDCLALQNHGLAEVAATLGTALTERHVRKIKGYAEEAVVVFDSDEAGVAAVLKSLTLFINEGLPASVVVFPEGHDPDSYVNANGLDRFQGLLDDAPTMFEFFLERKLVPETADVEAKVRAIREIVPILSELHNEGQRLLYGQRVSERMGIKEDVVWSELRTAGRRGGGRRVDNKLEDRLASSQVEKRFDDLHLLNLLIHYPEVAPRVMACEWKRLVSDAAITEIFEAFFRKIAAGVTLSPQEVLDHLQSDAARQQLSEALVEAPHYSAQEVEGAVAEMEEKAVQRKISASIQRAKERGDIEGLNELLRLKAQRSQGSG
jgi:DNA primase